MIATPVTKQDYSLLGNLAVSQGLVIRPPLAPAARRARPSIFFACRNEPPASLPRNLSLVHLKLNGCGTCIEHIVSVHDLFSSVVSNRFGNGSHRSSL